MQDIKQRLERVAVFPVKNDFSELSGGVRRALRHCIEAAKIMSTLYLKQAARGNLEISRYLNELTTTEGKLTAQYFRLQGSPWDAFANNEPFVEGIGLRPPFGSFYPRDFTKEEWDAWLAKYPESRALFESACTVIKRRDEDVLVAFRYSDEYRAMLRGAGDELLAASNDLPKDADEKKLKSFLEKRAASFLSNDYFSSDLAWVDTNGSPFEMTIGPYETYFDELLGLKAAFTAFIGLPDKSTTATLEKFAPLATYFDLVLSERLEYRQKGTESLIEVVHEVFRGGEAAFIPRMFVAYNLPNDRRVHEVKGSKKVFSRTMMEAKFSTLTAPIAKRVFSPSDAKSCTFDARLIFVLAHELAHGCGPNATKNGDAIDACLGDLYLCLEEAKADALGIRLLGYFRECGAIDDAMIKRCIFSNVLSWIQDFRQCYDSAHSMAGLMQYNWLTFFGAMHYDIKHGVFRINPKEALDALTEFSTECINLQLSGDYALTKTFVYSWTAIPSELPRVVECLRDIPVAVAPVYDLKGLGL